MKYLTFINVLVVLATILISPESQLVATTTRVDAQGDIHNVDFMNFTYYPDCLRNEDTGKAQAVHVKSGEYSTGSDSRPFQERLYFEINGPSFGDLNGDGIDEAALF